MIRIFIGFDPRETVAFNVLAHSIFRRASVPVTIAPIALHMLQAIHTRERNPLQSTDFSFTRFLTPYLSDYAGWSVFMDCDMLVLDDIANLFALRDDRYAVQVVKHVHIPRETSKFLNQPQSAYEKKNWSSVMLMNNAKCRALTPEYVNAASGLQLHQFKWLEGDHLIGEIPKRWNHLVGYQDKTADVSLIHYTLGGPYFTEYIDCDYGDEWRAELENLQYAERRRAPR